MRHQEIIKTDRLDQYVVANIQHLSRSAAVKLIESGQVKVNKIPMLKPSYRVQPEDKIFIRTEASVKKIPPIIDMPILFENEDFVVINKPSGILTHSKGDYNPEATVATWLSYRSPAMVGDRAGIVHRLDRATSGVMIVAKSSESLQWLQKQFSQRKVKKTYIAIIEGQPKEPAALIDMPIERNPKHPQTFRVGSHGKKAETGYKVISNSNKYSYIELKPTTGRTHQLRVHLKQLGHPILGDNLYGGLSADRLYLHAKELEITTPDKKRRIFTSTIPEEFDKYL
ncbi:MAG TPA: RluA family pseudouridine synthase [Candidatus Saccharimonadales bacterium]|nr:RluA family pseudouridine synthase [Candidatus Saccharimonadales bacterium]